MASDDESDPFASNEKDCGDEVLMEWARVSIKWFALFLALI